MVETTELYKRAARAYEIGRLRMAARSLAMIVPLAAACVMLNSEKQLSLYVAVGLAAAMMLLRWRNRRGVIAANVGMQGGAMLLVLGIVICALDMPGDFWAAGCAALCVIAALVSGLWIGMQPLADGQRAGRWPATTIAVLTATLGCIDLGLSLLAGIILALTLGSIVGGRFAARV
jgi:hypothetical protein